MLTQVAPEAVFKSAFSSAQSATASEPSRIASVSRSGEATEPASRWSRPITNGAESSPEATIWLNARPAFIRAPRPSQQIRAGMPWNLIRARAIAIQLISCESSGNSSQIFSSVR